MACYKWGDVGGHRSKDHTRKAPNRAAESYSNRWCWGCDAIVTLAKDHPAGVPALLELCRNPGCNEAEAVLRQKLNAAGLDDHGAQVGAAGAPAGHAAGGGPGPPGGLWAQPAPMPYGVAPGLPPPPLAGAVPPGNVSWDEERVHTAEALIDELYQEVGRLKDKVAAAEQQLADLTRRMPEDI